MLTLDTLTGAAMRHASRAAGYRMTGETDQAAREKAAAAALLNAARMVALCGM